MGWTGGRTSLMPIGIDVGSRRIKAVQMSRGPGGWRVEAATALARREPGRELGTAEVDHLSGALDRQGFHGSEVVLAAPVASVQTELLELPPRSSGAPLEQIAEMEVARTQRREPGTFAIAVWDLPASGADGGQTRLMTAACPHAEAERLLDAFEQAGWQVRAIDMHAWAIARACAAAAPGSDLLAALDLGASEALFQLMYRDVVVYERHLAELGLGRLHAALGEQFQLEPEMVEHLLGDVGLRGPVADAGRTASVLEAVRAVVRSHAEHLVREVGASLSYAAHLYRDCEVQRVMLAGGGAAIPGLGELLASALEVRVDPLLLGDVAPSPPSLAARCQAPEMAVAAGLARYE